MLSLCWLQVTETHVTLVSALKKNEVERERLVGLWSQEVQQRHASDVSVRCSVSAVGNLSVFAFDVLIPALCVDNDYRSLLMLSLWLVS